MTLDTRIEASLKAAVAAEPLNTPSPLDDVKATALARRRRERLAVWTVSGLALLAIVFTFVVQDDVEPSVVGSGVASEPDPSLPMATVATLPLPPTGGLVVPGCDDTAACASGFVLDDGVFYNLDCGAVRNSAVSDEVIGSGEFEGQIVSVNLVEGVSRSVMVAVSLPGGLCAEGDEAVTDWTMAFPQGADQDAVLEAACEVGELSTAQRLANGC